MNIKKGFTLIEILVVVTIIMLLTATAVVSYTTFLKTSRDAKRKADLEQVRAALEMYRSNTDTYPVGISVLTSGTVYIQSLPTDPKDSTYKYYYKAEKDSTGSACNASTIPCASYTLGTYLEGTTSTCSVTVSCTKTATPADCNYCVGPYGVDVPSTPIPTPT